MNRLTLILVLTMTVLLGSSGVSWSADFRKGMDAAKRGDYSTALKKWTPLAEQGNTHAQYNLGVMYEKGRGVPQDYKTAVKWYTLAAEQNDAVAQLNLSICNCKGQGVSKSHVRCHMWANLSASSGNERAAMLREGLRDVLSPSQIEQAQKLSRECVAKNYKGC